jgi:hypothetical protein
LVGLDLGVVGILLVHIVGVYVQAPQLRKYDGVIVLGEGRRVGEGINVMGVGAEELHGYGAQVVTADVDIGPEARHVGREEETAYANERVDGLVAEVLCD